MKNKNNEWLKDYQDFIEAGKTNVPKEVNESVFSKIKSLLRPSALMVFLKILTIHLVAGVVSLSICHQFGLNPFNTK